MRLLLLTSPLPPCSTPFLVLWQELFAFLYFSFVDRWEGYVHYTANSLLFLLSGLLAGIRGSVSQNPRALSGRLQGCRSQRKQGCQSFDHVLQQERHRPQLVLITGPDEQSASLQGDFVVYVSLRAPEESRVVAGQIVAALPRQYTCSQRPEHPAVPSR